MCNKSFFVLVFVHGWENSSHESGCKNAPWSQSFRKKDSVIRAWPWNVWSCGNFSVDCGRLVSYISCSSRFLNSWKVLVPCFFEEEYGYLWRKVEVIRQENVTKMSYHSRLVSFTFTFGAAGREDISFNMLPYEKRKKCFKMHKCFQYYMRPISREAYKGGWLVERDRNWCANFWVPLLADRDSAITCIRE